MNYLKHKGKQKHNTKQKEHNAIKEKFFSAHRLRHHCRSSAYSACMLISWSIFNPSIPVNYVFLHLSTYIHVLTQLVWDTGSLLEQGICKPAIDFKNFYLTY